MWLQQQQIQHGIAEESGPKMMKSRHILLKIYNSDGALSHSNTKYSMNLMRMQI